MGDQHSELRSPITHMVEAQHPMAAEFEHPSQRIANDRGAQMANVHLLGDVGA